MSEGALIAVIDAATTAASSPPLANAGGGREGVAPAEGGGERTPPRPSPAVAREGEKPAPQASVASSRKADIECALVVIGSGPGGYTAAFRAADLGLDTVLVERYDALGGVCLNVGCIPSKALLHAAALIDEASHSDEIGISFGKPKIDLDKLRGFKQDKVVGQFTKGLAGMAKQRKVRTVQGVASFVSPNELEIVGADGKADCCASGNASSPPVAGGEAAEFSVGRPANHGFHRRAAAGRRAEITAGGRRGHHRPGDGNRLPRAGQRGDRGRFMDQLMPGADKDLVKPLVDR